MFTIRYRSVLWFAAGAAVTVALVWSLLAWQVFAAPGPGESTVVSVTPTRVLDTRDPTNLGLAGPFVSAVSQKLQVTGATVPAGSTGLLNVTVVAPTAAGFLSIRPGDAAGPPTTSSLNFAAGVNLPNAVQVALPVAGAQAGQIDITYDAYGQAGPTTDVLIDVVGYTTNAGIQDLVTSIANNTTSINNITALLAAKADASALAAKANTNQLPIARSTREADGPSLVFGGYVSLVSTTLTVPSAGLVQVSASANVAGLSVASRMSCALALGPSLTPGGDLANTSRVLDLSADGFGQCGTVGAFSVAAAGTYAVHMVGTGGTGINVSGATINALFVPSGTLAATDEPMPIAGEP